MNKLYVFAAVGVGFAYFAGMGMVHESQKLDQVATAMNLSDLQRVAMRQCHQDMIGTQLTFPNSNGYIDAKVPFEICGCQAKSMTIVFKPEKFAEHFKIIKAVVDKKIDFNDIVISADSLQHGLTPQSAAAKLLLSLASCAEEYRKIEIVKMRKAAIDSGHPELAAKYK
jgi:hypothetical protein